MWNGKLDEAQAGIKIARRNINNVTYADDTAFTAETQEELMNLLMKMKEWKSWLKTQHSKNEDHGIRSHHSMVNRQGPMETVTNLIFLISIITADGDCGHEIKRCLLLGKKAMTNLDSGFKSKDITLQTKICIVKAMVFMAVIYRCESWTIKKVGCQRTEAFQLWCWRRLLRVTQTARRSN